MAVGRLPRDQRNVGGVDTAPRTPPARLASGRIQYPNVLATATLRQPQGVTPAGAHTYLVDVVDNVDVHGTPVAVRLEADRDGTSSGWVDAAWVASDGNYGTCAATIRQTVAGRYHVLVRRGVGQSTLYAGRIVVQ